jgi:hypothetical protein
LGVTHRLTPGLSQIDPADVPELRTIMGTEHGRQWKRSNGSDHPPAIELYISNRYFTVTGEGLEDSPTELRTVPLSDLQWLIETAGPKLVGKAKANGKDLIALVSARLIADSSPISISPRKLILEMTGQQLSSDLKALSCRADRIGRLGNRPAGR